MDHRAGHRRAAARSGARVDDRERLARSRRDGRARGNAARPSGPARARVAAAAADRRARAAARRGRAAGRAVGRRPRGARAREPAQPARDRLRRPARRRRVRRAEGARRPAPGAFRDRADGHRRERGQRGAYQRRHVLRTRRESALPAHRGTFRRAAALAARKRRRPAGAALPSILAAGRGSSGQATARPSCRPSSCAASRGCP